LPRVSDRFRLPDSYLLILLKICAMVGFYAVKLVTQPVPQGTIFLTPSTVVWRIGQADPDAARWLDCASASGSDARHE